ncbi:MAG: phosphatase PAP2 family protein [Acidimicrobiia bacterium]|nr:phosphatase PAP2 family protein [Acidimicrobiia bacterium]
MYSQISRRSFIKGSLVAGAGAAVSPILGPAVALAGPGHPLTKDHSPDVLNAWIPALYEAVRFERLSPPNAARVYAYFGVAAYEAAVGGMPQHRSLGMQLNDLAMLPAVKPSLRYDWPTAVNAAMGAVVQALFVGRIVSQQALADRSAAIHEERSAIVNDAQVMARSAAHGRAVAQQLTAWIERDGWADIQGLAFTPPTGPSLWVRTPPNFGASIEPYWERVRPFALDPVTSCTPVRPVAYSTDPGSAFYAQAQATHDAVVNLTDAQRETALIWRDNPDGSTGLPSGHWTLITNILIRDLGLDLARAVEVLALHGIAVADGFTSCWTEKYRTNLLRPVTYIQANIDPSWNSFVNSPAFPEYTSGHSVGSAAAATTLTAVLGPIGFIDTSITGYSPRSFSSPWEAAYEAANSRLLGGIHYPMGIAAGLDQGECVAKAVLTRVRTRRGNTRQFP